MQMSGSEMIPSVKSTRLWYCLPSCMHVRPGKYTNVIINHTGPEESRDAKHAVLKLAQLSWNGYVIRMPDERLLKKVFMEKTGRKAL